jgi:hypothetical protein
MRSPMRDASKYVFGSNRSRLRWSSTVFLSSFVVSSRRRQASEVI